MGCVTSSQKDVDSAPTGPVKALSAEMKTRFAKVDAKKLGDFADEAEARLAFVYGRTANIYIITTPPFHPSHPKHEEAKGNAAAAAGEEGEGASEQTPSPPPQHGETAAAEEEATREVRWTLFNDSDADAKVEFTFFHGDAIRSADEDAVRMERLQRSAVRAAAEVPAGATVPFVEGPIKGCMYKCVVFDRKTNAFEMAAAEKLSV